MPRGLIGICLFVSRIIKNYIIDFHKLRWKGGTWAKEEALDFGDNPQHGRGVTIGFSVPGAEAMKYPQKINRDVVI